MIEFESVSKTYRDGTTAVSELSLQIPSDKITVIVGPSGCGKTTTLRMINRMLEPSKGRILWDGNPLRSRRKTGLRRQMGYVIQNGGLFPHRTVIDNVTTVPGLLGWDRTKSRKRALELLNAVGLDSKLYHRYPAQLSGGQQQRVGVARALAADPIVLLMDEPFSAVDPVVRADLHELLLGLQRELSKTIVMITHDIDEAIKLGDQVAILRVGGRLAQFGTPQQLLDEPADSFVEGFIGRDRGYRALSFAPASALQLDRITVVRDAASADGGGAEPVLVVDSEAKPIGWVDRHHPGRTLPLGATFDPDVDTLRVAMDSALTSPVGQAVAVSHETGRYVGTVTAGAILAAVTRGRADIADQISDRQQGGSPQPAPVAEESGLAAVGLAGDRETSEQPTDRSGDQPVDQSVDRSADQLVDRSADQPRGESADGGSAQQRPVGDRPDELQGEQQGDQVESVADPTITASSTGERVDDRAGDRADDRVDGDDRDQQTEIRRPLADDLAPPVAHGSTEASAEGGDGSHPDAEQPDGRAERLVEPADQGAERPEGRP